MQSNDWARLSLSDPALITAKFHVLISDRHAYQPKHHILNICGEAYQGDSGDDASFARNV